MPEMARLARHAEDLGIDSIWVAETRFTRDAVTSAAAVAAATSRVRVATAVINPYTRGDVLTAVTTASLDELAGGRFVLGIGPGSPDVLARQGIAFERPLGRLRACVETVRAMLRGEPGPDGATLDFVPLRAEVPIHLGVTGPRALALAGEIADGVLLNGFLPVEYVPRAAASIRAAALAAGRDPGAVEIAGSTAVSVDDDPARAIWLARPMVTTYLALFPNIARESGIDPDRLLAIVAAWRAGGLSRAARLVQDEDIRRLACAGAPEEVRHALAVRRAAGVDLPVISFVDPAMHRHLAALAG